MSDIDFDELDKAVNSLVGDKKEDSSPKPETDEKSLSAANENDVESKQPNEEDKSSAGNLPTKRTGKFMDVKHSPNSGPSSLMNKTETNITPPTSNEITKEEKNEEKEDLQKTPGNMPDALENKDENNEQNGQEDKPEKPEEKDSDTESGLSFEETEPKGKEDNTDKDKKEDTPASPFIEGAEVDKRPLGGFSSESPVEPPSKEGEATDEKPAATETQAVELPPELDKDLVAIEAGESPDSIKGAEDMVEEDKDKDDKSDEEKEDDKKQEKTEESDAKKDEPKDHKEKIAELLASASSGSIPDQYKRENRSHELSQPAHPLFNAEHFKNSPAAVKKPKSTSAKIFQWVFIIVGLLLLGASLGAAIFVFFSR